MYAHTYVYLPTNMQMVQVSSSEGEDERQQERIKSTYRIVNHTTDTATNMN